jgi:hypothetical protein
MRREEKEGNEGGEREGAGERQKLVDENALFGFYGRKGEGGKRRKREGTQGAKIYLKLSM